MGSKMSERFDEDGNEMMRGGVAIEEVSVDD